MGHDIRSSRPRPLDELAYPDSIQPLFACDDRTFWSRRIARVSGDLFACSERRIGKGDWPYLWIDATYVKVRESGRIVSAAVIIAVGVNSDGRREVLGMDIGPSEAETFWTAFVRKLARRGLRGVKLVISDAHEGLKAAVSKVLHASWQRCRVHFMRNVLVPINCVPRSPNWLR